MTILFGKIIQFKLIFKIIRCHFYPISTQCALLLKMATSNKSFSCLKKTPSPQFNNKFYSKRHPGETSLPPGCGTKILNTY